MGFSLSISCPMPGCRYNRYYRYTDPYDVSGTSGEDERGLGKEHPNHDWNLWAPPTRSPMAKSWTKARMIDHLSRRHHVAPVDCALLTAGQLRELHEEAELRDRQKPQ